MIIVKIQGGLGNQMFQYATAYALSRSKSKPIELDIHYYHTTHKTDTPRDFLLSQFEITGTIRNKPTPRLLRVLAFFRKRIARQYYTDYHEEILTRQTTRYYLDGFFQSEKYFHTYRQNLLQEFSLKNTFRNHNLLGSENDILNHPESISLHIRRGDYVSDTKTNVYHGLCTLEYYTKAMNHFNNALSNPHFFIFSDDIEWAKNNLSNSNNVTYVSNKNFTPPQELHLMSKCKHNIIANSTFSWWGAWLNQNPDKIVIAPKKWTNKIPDPHPNIIPDTWIRM